MAGTNRFISYSQKNHTNRAIEDSNGSIKTHMALALPSI